MERLADPPPAPAAAPRAEIGANRMAFLIACGNVVVYSLLGLTRAFGWGSANAAEVYGAGLGAALLVTAINLGVGLLVICGVFALRPMSRSVKFRYLTILTFAFSAAFPRVLALLALHPGPSDFSFLLAEWLAGGLAATLAVGGGVLTASLVERVRSGQRLWLSEARRAQQSRADLQAEETRVRRMVADQLHGNLQFQLVAITAGLDSLTERLASGDTAVADELRDLATKLDEVRERDIRGLSHSVYPAGIELGLLAAVRAMVYRLPPQVRGAVEWGPELRKLLDSGAELPLTERLLAAFVIEEAITNAMRHGGARSVTIDLELCPVSELGGLVLRGRIDDDGVGFRNENPGEGLALNTVRGGVSGTGLARLTDRVTGAGGTLTLHAGLAGGARVEFTLPFTVN